MIDDSINSDGTVNASATMIASDSNAVFYDMDAVSNGTGTAASPYDNPYDAISNVGTKRYIYGKGTIVPDGTDTGSPFGASTVAVIDAPATRASEAARLYIRSWPGSSLTVDGDTSTQRCGFLANSNESYHTYRGIGFTDLDGSGDSESGWGIWYHYGTSAGINVEHCTFSEINGNTGTNVGGFCPWGVEGVKVWRCSFDNSSVGGSYTNGNATGIMSFIGDKVSVQRCHFGSNMGVGIYHKTTATGEIAFNVRFCFFDDVELHYGTSSPGHNGILTTNNVFDGSSAIIRHQVDSGLQSDNQISNNYFYLSGSGTVGAIHSRRMEDAVIYGNIFDACRGAFYDTVSSATQRYVDYNVTNGVTYEDWQIASTYYSSSAAMNTAVGFGANDTEGDPDPTNAASDDFTLGGSSVASGASIGATDAGVYLLGNEVIGP